MSAPGERPDLPDLGRLVAPLFAQCTAPGEDRLLLARLERLAAGQYRRWAEQAGAEHRHGMLDAALREEEVAAAIEGPVGEAGVAAATGAADLAGTYERALDGLTLVEQWTVQAAAERAGAALLRAFAAEADDRAQNVLLTAAEREERNAEFLDLVIARRPASPRVPPVGDDDLDDQQRELLGTVTVPGAVAVNIFATLVRNPGLFRHWLPFGGKLLAGRIPARDRELLILRTGWHCRAAYEWGQHARIALDSGVTEGEIERVVAGPDAPGWDPFDATLLRAADELHRGACITDATWAQLAARYDERQLVELPMLVGHYHMVAFALNSLGVQREPGVADLPDAPRTGE